MSAPGDLIARLKAGEPAAHNEWVAKHRKDLTDWTARVLGVSPGHGGDASDVFGTAAVKIWEKIPVSINTEAQLLKWFKRVLRHRAVDNSRKQLLMSISFGVPGGSSSGSGPGGLAQVVASITSPSLRAARNEREEAIEQALGDLPEEESISDHAIVLVRVVDECPLKAIAASLKLSPIEVARRYFATADRIRDTLVKYPSPKWTDSQVALRRAIAELPERQRQAMELFHFEPATYSLFDQATGEYKSIKCKYALEVVGEVLSCSPAAAAQLVRRAKEGLKKHIN